MNCGENNHYVYIIGPSVGPVKIGRSVSPEVRVEQLQRAAGIKLYVSGAYPVGQAVSLSVERYAHWLLREKHIGREWFDATREEAAAAIERALSLDHSPSDAMPPLDIRDREIRGGIYVRTKLPRETYDRMSIASDRQHAQFIREAIESELKRRERIGK